MDSNIKLNEEELLEFLNKSDEDKDKSDKDKDKSDYSSDSNSTNSLNKSDSNNKSQDCHGSQSQKENKGDVSAYTNNDQAKDGEFESKIAEEKINLLDQKLINESIIEGILLSFY